MHWGEIIYHAQNLSQKWFILKSRSSCLILGSPMCRNVLLRSWRSHESGLPCAGNRLIFLLMITINFWLSRSRWQKNKTLQPVTEMDGSLFVTNRIINQDFRKRTACYGSALACLACRATPCDRRGRLVMASACFSGRARRINRLHQL